MPLSVKGRQGSERSSKRETTISLQVGLPSWAERSRSRVKHNGRAKKNACQKQSTGTVNTVNRHQRAPNRLHRGSLWSGNCSLFVSISAPRRGAHERLNRHSINKKIIRSYQTPIPRFVFQVFHFLAKGNIRRYKRGVGDGGRTHRPSRKTTGRYENYQLHQKYCRAQG